ncbi:MAG: hypothetical protein V7L25_31510 [Nostoc sp.]|uniref:hypothetical protein n=1 Tax=Nostoc sp. TaxID=1180 RepID=UPI002FF3CEE2
MNSKQYARERKLTLKQFNELATLILGSVPASLEEEQIARLDAALAEAAQQVNALPEVGTEATDAQEATEPAPLATADSNSIEASSTTTQVIELLGEDMLRRNIAIFLTHHIRSLRQIQETYKTILGKFEQQVYTDTADTFARMTRNVQSSLTGLRQKLSPNKP